MSKYEVEIQGESPLLVNRFTEETAAKISAGSTVLTIAGSRGTPREQAETKLYRSADGAPILPGPNIFRGLIDAGTYQKFGRRPLTTGRSSMVPAGIQGSIRTLFRDKVVAQVRRCRSAQDSLIQGAAGQGLVRRGEAWLGMARLGMAAHGEARSGGAMTGWAVLGTARLGEQIPTNARQGFFFDSSLVSWRGR